MIILGIDPGTATTGFACIEKVSGQEKCSVLDFGIISTPKQLPDSERLTHLYQDVSELIKTYKPERAGVEKLFFSTNSKTAMTVSQARGVVLLALALHTIPILEFTPLQVKSTICGYGKADKKQVQHMVQVSFNLKSIPKPDDAADALAIALCTAFKSTKEH